MTTKELVPLTKDGVAGAAPEAEGTAPEHTPKRKPEQPEKPVFILFGHDASIEEMWAVIRDELQKRRRSGEEG